MSVFRQILFGLLLWSCTNSSGSITTSNICVNNNDSQELTVIFVGDAMCHYPQITAAKTESGYDFSDCFKYMKEFWSQSDFVVANLETTLGYKNYSGYPCFSSPREFVQGLKNNGVNVLVTANNHCCDRGLQGINNTAKILDSMGFCRTGTFIDSSDYSKNNPLFLSKNGIEIALLNYTYGTNGLPVPTSKIVNLIDTANIKADISKARIHESDIIIVYLHWGEEYSFKESSMQRNLAKWLHSQGVDVVIGSHPHVVQRAELIEGCPVVYSLGNFVSNQRTYGSDGGINVCLKLIKKDDKIEVKVEYLNVWVQIRNESEGNNYYAIPLTKDIDTIPLIQYDKDKISVFDRLSDKVIGDTIFFKKIR